MVELQHVSKSYGSNVVLRDVQLVLPKGQITGLVGMNGAGKTTLLRCLLGLTPCGGNVQSEVTELRSVTGYVPTSPTYPSFVTGREYLRLVLEARGVRPERLDERNVFGLPLDQYAEHYSTGEGKKLALLGALLQDNDFLVLDEPFSGVDIGSNLLLLALLKRFRENGKAILVTSHLLETLYQMCDEVYVLQHGRVSPMTESHAVAELSVQPDGMNVTALVDRVLGEW